MTSSPDCKPDQNYVKLQQLPHLDASLTSIFALCAVVMRCLFCDLYIAANNNNNKTLSKSILFCVSALLVSVLKSAGQVFRSCVAMVASNEIYRVPSNYKYKVKCCHFNGCVYIYVHISYNVHGYIIYRGVLVLDRSPDLGKAHHNTSERLGEFPPFARLFLLLFFYRILLHVIKCRKKRVQLLFFLHVSF